MRSLASLAIVSVLLWATGCSHEPAASSDSTTAQQPGADNSSPQPPATGQAPATTAPQSPPSVANLPTLPAAEPKPTPPAKEAAAKPEAKPNDSNAAPMEGPDLRLPTLEPPAGEKKPADK